MVSFSFNSLNGCEDVRHAIEEGNIDYLISFLKFHRDILFHVLKDIVVSSGIDDYILNNRLCFPIEDLAVSICEEINRRKRIGKFYEKVV